MFFEGVKRDLREVMVFDRELGFRVLLDGRIWVECAFVLVLIFFWVIVLDVLALNEYR